MAKNESNFFREFKACMYEYVEEVDFQIICYKLLRYFNLQEKKQLIIVCLISSFPVFIFKKKERKKDYMTKNAFGII